MLEEKECVRDLAVETFFQISFLGGEGILIPHPT
jgi:hypothetical protein